MRNTIAVAATALIIGSGCGNDGASTESFCDDLDGVQSHLSELALNDPSTLDSTVDALDDVDPPDEIAGSYNAVLDVYTSLADDGGSITDPALATEFADVRSEITRIDDFITDNCTSE